MAVGVVFEEGEVSGMEEADDDVDGMVLEVVVVVVVVVFGLPSPPFFLLLLVLLGFIAQFGGCNNSYLVVRGSFGSVKLGGGM